MKTIIITGAADGLGKAIATILNSGNKLILVDKDKIKIEEVAKKLRANFYAYDLGQVRQVVEFYNFAIAKFKTIDILINCAGVWLQGEPQVSNLDNVNDLIHSNTLSNLFVSTKFIQFFDKQKKGQIININSMAGVEYEYLAPYYCVSKHANHAFRKTIENDLANKNIKITDINPGLMNTRLFEKAGNIIPGIEKAGLDVAKVARVVKMITELDDEICIPQLDIKSIYNFD